MSTVRARLVPRVSVLAARWTQFVAGHRRLSRLLQPIMGARLETKPARGSGGGRTDRHRPVHFPQVGRGTQRLNALPEVETAEFDALVASARRKREVIVEPAAARAPWAAEAIAVLGSTGAPMSWTGPPDEVPVALGAELGEAMTGSYGHGRHGRELRSIRIRRAALALLDECRGHDASGVTVLLASKRPADVERAVEFVGRQRGTTVQLLVGLHGPEWADGAVERIERLGPPDTTVLRFGVERNLGDLLGALTAHARHDLVAKWDDDDWYGDEHLADLVQAYRYSGADIVGKAAEFVYLEQSDVTTRRFAFGAESYSWTLAGGALLTSTEWLERVGGWRSVAHGVDRELLAATRRLGGSAYRTHGFQYVLRRRGGDVHTWAVPDGRFLAAASTQRPGLDLAYADVAGSPS